MYCENVIYTYVYNLFNECFCSDNYQIDPMALDR